VAGVRVAATSAFCRRAAIASRWARFRDARRCFEVWRLSGTTQRYVAGDPFIDRRPPPIGEDADARRRTGATVSPTWDIARRPAPVWHPRGMAVGSLAVSWGGGALAGARFAAWASAGVLAWTLAEYALHRLDMHGRRSRGATSREHRRHHATVDVPALTADTWAGAAIVAAAMGWWAHVGMGVGWMAAYVGYELLHKALHRGERAPAGDAGGTADPTAVTPDRPAAARRIADEPGASEARGGPARPSRPRPPGPDDHEYVATPGDPPEARQPTDARPADGTGDPAAAGRAGAHGRAPSGGGTGLDGTDGHGRVAPRRTPWGLYRRWALGHHLHHHHVDARRNYGVTTPLWDHAFRTHARPAPSRSRRPTTRRPG
jgi:hypothetical protein